MSIHSDRKPRASFPRHRRRLRSCRERIAQKEEEWNEGVRTETQGVPGSVGGRPQGSAVWEALWRSSAAPRRLDLPASRPHSPEAVLLHGAPGPRTWGRTWRTAGWSRSRRQGGLAPLREWLVVFPGSPLASPQRSSFCQLSWKLQQPGPKTLPFPGGLHFAPHPRAAECRGRVFRGASWRW